MEEYPFNKTDDVAIVLINNAFEDTYECLAEKVDAVFEEIGARVVNSLTYTGEDNVRLYISPQQTPNLQEWHNRPA